MSELTRTFTCQGCGVSEARRMRGSPSKWCASCRSHMSSRILTKLCPACGGPGVRRDATYCSRECARLSGHGVRPAKPKPPPKPRRYPKAPASHIYTPLCAVCGRAFVTRWTISTCSPECANTKRQDDKRSARHIRRARKRGAFVAPVSPRYIFERDGWRCLICRGKVERGAVVPHPLAPTVDHIIPLASGGTHEPSNCQTAHYRCNAAKGVAGVDQLRLIG